MLLKLFQSFRCEEWIGPVFEWLEIEAKARLGIFVVKIQNLYRRQKAHRMKHLMRFHKEHVRMQGHSLTITYSLTHSLTHLLLAYSHTHLLTYSLTRLLTN